MKITFVEKNYKIGNRFKDVMTEKLSKLDRYFGEDATARVVASEQNKMEKLEVTITNKGVLYRSEVKSDNNYNNIDLALPKLEKQIVRSREKLTQSKRTAPKSVGFEFLEEMPELKLPEVYKKKTFELEPTMIEEAKDAIERLGHSFYIFLNAETGKVNVLYKRADNKYGLIEVNF
ncbi:MAG: ribosome-associated translation inhibitor RaiA [Clostridia bacterium]|nr:ribosome-associated translation inhibitor RaiA [Clostridia bacterium]